jgi:uridine kinase
MMASTTEPSKPIVVGIAGGTGAGKTTFARSIYAAFGGTGWGVRSRVNIPSDLSTEDECHITYLSHDDYYKDLSHLPFESRSCTNFDHPSSLDTDLMIQHISDLLEGKSVVVPRYDFSRHCRFQEGEIDNEGRTTGRVVESKKIILVEGILILSIRELVNIMDLKVFVVRILSIVSIIRLSDFLLTNRCI